MRRVDSSNNKDKTRFSKYLSYILRHEPESIGIELEVDGWVDINTLIEHINKAGEWEIDTEVLEVIVKEDEKSRYKIDKGRIRANQGHSIKNLEMNFKEIDLEEAPDILYHGTSVGAYDKIMSDGFIKKMDRQYVHLSKDYETAAKVGVRHGELKVFKIDVKKLLSKQKLYISDNGVYLTEDISTDMVMEG